MTESAYAYLLIVALFFLILIIIDIINEFTKKYQPYTLEEFNYHLIYKQLERDLKKVDNAICKMKPEDSYYRMKTEWYK